MPFVLTQSEVSGIKITFQVQLRCCHNKGVIKSEYCKHHRNSEKAKSIRRCIYRAKPIRKYYRLEERKEKHALTELTKPEDPAGERCTCTPSATFPWSCLCFLTPKLSWYSFVFCTNSTPCFWGYFLCHFNTFKT